MSDEQKDTIEALERRVAALENIVRRLTLAANTADRAQLPAPPPRPIAPPPARPRPQPPAIRPPVRARSSLDLEQWFGQRGLLAVGILALLATGGFFLNYAIEHGWIPPIVRASGAIVTGVALAAWGDRLGRRGMLRYGATIVGGGGGLVYLGIWAAAGPYALLSREVGTLLLAATSGLVVALAIRHSVEGLAIWALAGAYLAPIFLASSEAVPARFLGYLAVVGTSFMVLGERLSWRATFNTALFGFFLLPAAIMSTELTTTVGVNYALLGAVIALLATDPKRAQWPEARIGALVMVWTLLFGVHGADSVRWVALSGGALITVIVWWQQLRSKPLEGIPRDLGPEFIVYLTPLALVTLGVVAGPSTLARWGGLLPLGLAALYLGTGWPLRARHLVVMGFVLVALAISGQWDGAAVAAGWAVLALVATASGVRGGRPGAREVAAVLTPVAFVQLFTIALSLRPHTDPAFIGRWSLAWYVSLVALTLVAQQWGRSREDRPTLLLWSLPAAALLFGASFELTRALDPPTFYAAAALVMYWTIFAVALVRVSFAAGFELGALALRAALLIMGAGYLLLFSTTWTSRGAADPAFLGIWSVAWYVSVAGALVAVRWWPPTGRVPAALRQGHAALWWMAGGNVLLGGSLELQRVFPSELAGNLAISTFWLVYAGALVRVGFWLDRKVVRSAGLAVAALAALKIVLYDLSALEALYRVGSFFVLALITLAVAYAYNKRAKASRASAA